MSFYRFTVAKVPLALIPQSVHHRASKAATGLWKLWIMNANS